MNNALLYIGGLLVAVLSALFAVPHFVDWNGYRGVFEEEASRVLSRDVRVGGSVNVRLLPVPYVRFEKVRVADAGGGTGEPFFRADEFTLWLSVPPLLRGVIEANAVELKRPRLNLRADSGGRGNWTSLSLSPGSLPLVPTGVSLQSVRISDGQLGLATSGGADDIQLTGVNGELEAESLAGPYKFKGAVFWREAERQIRISTARPDADGGIRLKSVVTAPLTGNAYVFDGRLSDLGGRVRLDGEVQGKMRVDGLAAAGAAAGSQAAPAQEATPRSAFVVKDDGQRPYIDIKAALAADLTAARLGQIVVSVENIGQPQLITGDARVAWTGQPTIELALASRWLDLDRLAGRDPGEPPIDTAQALMSALLGQLPGGGRVDARFEVEQTSLGGEAVSGLSLKLGRDGGPLEVRELKAGLPGGARLDIAGTLTNGGAAPELDGTMFVRGSSLGRFLVWAGKSKALAEGRTDGPFLVRAKLRLGGKALALTEGLAEINGVPLAGEVRYEPGERRRVALRLEGQSLDVAQVWPGAPAWLAGLLPALRDGKEEASGAGRPPATAGSDATSTDVALQLRFAELAAAGRTYRDVDADVALERGRISIPRLKLATADGLDLDVEGDITDAAGRPSGTVRGVIAAERPEAVEAVLASFADAAAVEAARSHIPAVLPLRLAGRVTIGRRSASAVDIDADGLVRGGRFVGSARLDGGWSGWRENAAEITATADNSNVDQLLRLVLGTVAEATAGRPPRRGQVSLKAQGVPAQGMLAAASLASQGLVLSYDGPLKLERGAPLATDGELRITADDVAEALALAGISIGGIASGTPVDGVLHVSVRDSVLSLKPRELAIGSRKVGGHLIVAQRSGKPSTVTADLELAEVSVAELLMPLLERRSQEAAMAQAAVSGGVDGGQAGIGGHWPDLAFDLQPLDRIDGKVAIRFARLGLKGPIALGPGRLVARLVPGKLDVESLEATSLGGRFSSTMSFARTRGGVDARIAVRATGLQPALLAPPGGARSAAQGPLALTLDLEGKAASPRGLIGVLKGKGTLEHAGLTLPGLTPEVVAQRSEDLVGGKIEPGDGALTRTLEAALGGVALPAGRHVLDVADGTMRMKPFTVATATGRTQIDTTLDLGELRIDSEWRIDNLPPSPGAATGAAATRSSPLPPVYVVYAGELGRLAAIAPRLSAGALERELAVRKMERDVEELERLRKEDERRRIEEAERLRQIEAERARAAADPAVATPAAEPAPAGVSPTGTPVEPPPTQANPAASNPASGLPPTAAPIPSPPQAAADPAAPAAERASPALRPPPPPRPVRRVSPADEILRQLTPN